MYPALIQRVLRRLAAFALVTACVIAAPSAADWPEWRGPARDGHSTETNLPAAWSPRGENLAWRIPIGSRSSPVAFGNRLYLNSPVGAVDATQERLVAIDAETGKVVWEKRFSLYLSDVPQHRASWASPAVDPETGNIYMFTVAAQLVCVSPDGKILWDRSLPDEYGAVTTHGGRTMSPIIEGDKVILNALILAWGDLNRTGNRYFAFDKKTGQTVWISSPQTRHYDTNYSTPIVGTIDGTRALIVGGTDGVYHALKVNTGEKLWSMEVSKRAILNSAAAQGQRRLHHARRREHGHHRDGHDRRGRRDPQRRAAARRVQVAHARVPAVVRLAGDGRRAPLHGRQQRDRRRVRSQDRREALGDDRSARCRRARRCSPTASSTSAPRTASSTSCGRRRPASKCSTKTCSARAQAPEPIIASPIVSDGRVYVTSMDATYAIGKRVPRKGAPVRSGARARCAASPVRAALVQVFPYESLVTPGQTRCAEGAAVRCEGQLHSRRAGRAVVGRSGRRCGRRQGRVHRAPRRARARVS